MKQPITCADIDLLILYGASLLLRVFNVLPFI